MIKCPCKQCEKRGCGTYHDKCSDYQTYLQKCEHIRQQRYKEGEQIRLQSKQWYETSNGNWRHK